MASNWRIAKVLLTPTNPIISEVFQVKLTDTLEIPNLLFTNWDMGEKSEVLLQILNYPSKTNQNPFDP